MTRPLIGKLAGRIGYKKVFVPYLARSKASSTRRAMSSS